MEKKLVEVSLLEVSGSLSETNMGRFTKDHIKAGFGILALLQEIGYGLLDTFASILIYFVHVMGK